MRLSKVCKNFNVGLGWIKRVLDSLGYNNYDMNLNSQIPDEVVELLEVLVNSDDEELLSFIGRKVPDLSSQIDSSLSSPRVIDKIDVNSSSRIYSNATVNTDYVSQKKVPILTYNEEHPDFYIKELYVFNSEGGRPATIKILNDSIPEQRQLFSVLIGENGVGKSSLLRDLSEFFTDVHRCSEASSFVSASYDGKLAGVCYCIDGQECLVVKIKKI